MSPLLGLALALASKWIAKPNNAVSKPEKRCPVWAAFFAFVPTMKKTTLLLLSASLLLSSCYKHCTCKTWYDGYVPVYHEGVELDKSLYSQCSDMDNITNIDPKEGIECIDE